MTATKKISISLAFILILTFLSLIANVVAYTYTTKYEVSAGLRVVGEGEEVPMWALLLLAFFSTVIALAVLFYLKACRKKQSKGR